MQQVCHLEEPTGLGLSAPSTLSATDSEYAPILAASWAVARGIVPAGAISSQRRDSKRPGRF